MMLGDDDDDDVDDKETDDIDDDACHEDCLCDVQGKVESGQFSADLQNQLQKDMCDTFGCSLPKTS